MTSYHTALWLALSVGAGVCLQASDASAYVEMGANGAASCKPSNPARASAFFITNFYTENTSTVNEYLTCSMPQWNVNGYLVGTVATHVYFSGTAAGGTVLCTAQSGYHYGSLVVAQANTQTLMLAPGMDGSIQFPSLSRSQPYYSVAFTCRIPPGFKVGLIRSFDSNPPSGFAWVP